MVGPILLKRFLEWRIGSHGRLGHINLFLNGIFHLMIYIPSLETRKQTGSIWNLKMGHMNLQSSIFMVSPAQHKSCCHFSWKVPLERKQELSCHNHPLNACTSTSTSRLGLPGSDPTSLRINLTNLHQAFKEVTTKMILRNQLIWSWIPLMKKSKHFQIKTHLVFSGVVSLKDAWLQMLLSWDIMAHNL